MSVNFAAALARIAELQALIARIDIALDVARAAWLRSVPTDRIDAVYAEGVEEFEATRMAAQVEIANLRMAALL